MEEGEKQVWQRVMDRPISPQNTDIRGLVRNAMEAVEIYQELLRSTPGKARELLKRLTEGEQANIACMRGLYTLQTGRQLKLFPVFRQELPGRQDLIMCYHNARKALTEYTARSAEPEWGCVYHAMAQRQEGQCAILAQLLGMIK